MEDLQLIKAQLIIKIDNELNKAGERYKKRYDIESNFQTALINNLKKIFGENLWLVKVSDRYMKGVPDVLLCIAGCFVALELKAKNGKPTKLQCFTIDKIRKAGGTSCIVQTMEEALLTIKSALMI